MLRRCKSFLKGVNLTPLWIHMQALAAPAMYCRATALPHNEDTFSLTTNFVMALYRIQIYTLLPTPTFKLIPGTKDIMSVLELWTR